MLCKKRIKVGSLMRKLHNTGGGKDGGLTVCCGGAGDSASVVPAALPVVDGG